MTSGDSAEGFLLSLVKELLFVLGMFSALAQPVLASQATARCADLEQQLQVALKAHPGSKATKAAPLGVEAHKLCTHAQPALGLRTYVKAFRALGVEPKLPQE
jgi:hypothetical protein